MLLLALNIDRLVKQAEGVRARLRRSQQYWLQSTTHAYYQSRQVIGQSVIICTHTSFQHVSSRRGFQLLSFFCKHSAIVVLLFPSTVHRYTVQQ
jgi:hypothetical protein